MRAAHLLVAATAMAGAALLSPPTAAEQVCDPNCVGQLCSGPCADRDRDLTVGRGARDSEFTIEEHRRVREPSIEIRRPRSGAEIHR
jgi:hypothetical protein